MTAPFRASWVPCPAAPRRAAAPLVLALLWTCSAAAAQDAAPAPPRQGAEVYRIACAACHGPDGRGAPASAVGFDLALPDFTDCRFATREAAADWFAVTHAGGPVRAFDRRMPAFGEALSGDEIARAIDHLRRFCGDARWPYGELNLPRALVTEKAYPEDEAVLTTTAARGALLTHLLYERRIGARSQIELAVPVALREGESGWAGGLGDVAVAFKHVLAHSAARGAIVSAAAEVVLPTGEEARGLGSGRTRVEPFVAVGAFLPRGAFVQTQTGVELTAGGAGAETEAFWRAAAGRPFERRQFGRVWTPMLELLGARALEAGARVEWDLLPQLQVTLSKRQHVLISGGLRLPLTARNGRPAQVMTYLLWDWFDGGLREGWR